MDTKTVVIELIGVLVGSAVTALGFYVGWYTTRR